MPVEDLIIKKSVNTPEVNFKFDSGSFRISGVLDPVDPGAFFEPLISKLEGFAHENINASSLEISLDYIRISSIPALLKLLDKFHDLTRHGQKVKVSWITRAEDEAIREAGEELSRKCLLNFEFLEK